MSTEVNRHEEIRRALERAEELRKEGKPDEGITLLSDALRYGIDQAQIFYKLGNLYFDAKKLEHAEYSYRRAIDHDETHINAHYNLGVVLKKLGRVDESMKLRKKANKLAQQNPERLTVSTEQVKQIRTFAKKIFYFGMIFIIVVVIVLFLVFR